MHIAKSGRLIIKCESVTSANSFIFDKRGNKIAKIQEIFGPINSPYISAITLSEKAKRVIGKKVYKDWYLITRNSEEAFCNFCKTSLIGDVEKGEVVCPTCGVVGVDHMIDSGPEWKAINSEDKIKRVRTGAPISLALHDFGLTTQIGETDSNSSKDSYSDKSIQRMKKWQRRIRTSSSRERGLANVLGKITEFSDHLTLPKSTSETAAHIYRSALRTGTAKSKSINGMAAASIYLACRRCGTSRSIGEVANVADLPKATVSRYYRLILKEGNQEYVPLHSLKTYISKIVNIANLNPKIERLAITMSSQIKDSTLSSGKSPVGIAAAFIYISSVMIGEKIPQREIAEDADITEVTIRNRTREILNKYKIKQIIKIKWKLQIYRNCDISSTDVFKW